MQDQGGDCIHDNLGEDDRERWEDGLKSKWNIC
jgi:hypothetical protein